MPTDFPSPLLPYAQASSLQRTQALGGARRILDAAYPFVSYAQWQQALAQLGLPVQVTADQASLSPDGLAALVQYLEEQYRSPLPALTAAPAAATPAAPGPTSSLASLENLRKQTYAIPPSQITGLARVSYWCRRPVNQLVIEAIAQLLHQHPEADQPVLEPVEGRGRKLVALP